MQTKLLVVLSVLTLHVFVAYSADSTTKLVYVPQVAFICNKPAMHMTPSGSWEADVNTGCLNQPKDILDYCKKLYPSLDITNIMESSEPTTISNWCRVDQKDSCSGSRSQHVVYSYRCVVGQFESEPLLVPEHCQFDHVHDASKCLPETTWHGRAFEECGKKMMLLQSSSMLMPCGTELFNGVEFVCCPKSKSVDTTSSPDPVILKSDSADAAPDTRSPTDPMQNFGGALSTVDTFESDEDSDDDDDDEGVEDQNADSILKELRAGNVGPVILQTEKPTSAAPVSSTAKPAVKQAKTAKPNADLPVSTDDDDDDDDDYEDDEDYYESDLSTTKAQQSSTAAPTTGTTAASIDNVPLWRLYLAGDLAGTEHEYDKEQQLFEEVMVSWRADFASREQQLKKDWEDAKANVKQTAGDQATLNAVSEEFRRSFNTLKDQGANEHIRLLDVHDQRIQSRLIQRQKVATKRLSDAIQNAPADAEEVADYLEDLIDIEEKQKKHAVNYFSKLRSIQPTSADKVLNDLKLRIRRVEDQLKQSMDLLKKLPERDVNKIKPEITAYLKTYQDVEDAASLMLRLIPSPVQQAAADAASALGVKLPTAVSDNKKVVPPTQSSEEDDEPALGLLGRPGEEDDDEDDDDFGEDEEEGAGIDVKPQPAEPMEYNNKIKAEIGAIRADAEQVNDSVESSSTIGLSTALVIGSAIAAAFLLILVAGLLVYRGVARRRYAGRMLVTTAISPEERHVVNMQSNGYENPTYKYFYEVHA